MNDVVIRRCTLRVVRHGGWSWGLQRRSILANATAALPRLIAERLAELLADVDGEITQPIRLRFALRAGQLASGDGLASVVATGIRPAMLPLPAKGTKTDVEHDASMQSDGGAKLAIASPKGDESPFAGDLARAIDVLLRWRDQGWLWQRLEAFSPRALDLWLSALVRDVPPASPASSIAETLRRDCTALVHSIPIRADDPASTQRARLAVAVELVARYEDGIGADVILGTLNAAIPLPATQPTAAKNIASRYVAPGVAMTSSEAVQLTQEKTVAAAPPAQVRTHATEGRIALCSVLPYLVLGALHRLGWLDVASATLRALNLPDRGSAFATALACKLLPPAERGWHRTNDELRTAAAFAGVRVPPSPSELARWSLHASDGLSPLDDFVVAELARCHDCSLPLLVMHVESRHERPWLLFDADGCFPVAWLRDETSLGDLVRRFGPCVILVSAEAATPALMHRLVADHRSVVTSATPSRHDDWRRVKGTACWTDGEPALPRRLLESAGILPELMAQALAVTRELLHLRPAASPREGAELEHSCALAAAVGLGSLAAALWRKRETVHPLLALERFGNLDGVARIDAGIVEIVPAFGRRYLDLQEHGLLADIPAPPWMDARRIVFAGP